MYHSITGVVGGRDVMLGACRVVNVAPPGKQSCSIVLLDVVLLCSGLMKKK